MCSIKYLGDNKIKGESLIFTLYPLQSVISSIFNDSYPNVDAFLEDVYNNFEDYLEKIIELFCHCL